jgi:transketolase N-terminal domain/subunit
MTLTDRPALSGMPRQPVTIREGAMFAIHHRLENLIVVVDANQFQAMGRISQVLNTEPLGDKFNSFGFATSECNSHDLHSLDRSMQGLIRVLSRVEPRRQVL